jgi:hypothetical protein
MEIIKVVQVLISSRKPSTISEAVMIFVLVSLLNCFAPFIVKLISPVTS